MTTNPSSSPSFPIIFEHLNFCRDRARVVISQQKLSEDEERPHNKIAVNDHWLFGSRTFSWFFQPSPSEKGKMAVQNVKTIQIFKKCVNDYVGGHITEKTQRILEKLNNLEESGKALTAGKIRKIYSELVAEKLTGIRKIAALARDDDRIVLKNNGDALAFKVQNIGMEFFKQNAKRRNRQTIDVYLQSLYRMWGVERVERALKRMKVDLHQKRADGLALLVKDVNMITIGIADYYKEDLELCWNRIRLFIQGQNSKDDFPLVEWQKLAKCQELPESSPELIRSKLYSLYNEHVDLTFKKLPVCLKEMIQNISHFDADELELAFQGKRMEGVVDGLQSYTSQMFFKYVHIEDQEKLQMFYTILKAREELPKGQLQPFFDEILVKGIVKKDMEEGMMIPSPWKPNEVAESDAEHESWYTDESNGSTITPADRSWYTVRKRILTGRGKLAYHLKAYDDNERQDILQFCSTRSAPSSTDSISTILTDIFPFCPPGYLWGRSGEDIEKNILNNNVSKTLRIMGHSLGGSHAQLLFIHRILNKKGEFINDLPLRNYELVTFDSPQIRRADAQKFADWLNNPENEAFKKKISISHYISKGDDVPKSGEALLGWQINDENLKSKKLTLLRPTKSNTNPCLKIHPHGNHYFRTRYGYEYIHTNLNIEEYTKNNWDIIEVIRRIVGMILFPVVFLLSMVKRFFFGWRGGLSGITHVWHRVFPRKALSGTI